MATKSDELHVGLKKAYPDADYMVGGAGIILCLYMVEQPHLRKPWQVGIGSSVVIPTGIVAKAPRGYHFQVHATLRGYIVSDWRDDLAAVDLHNLSSAISMLRHGEEIAMATLVANVPFTVKVAEHAAR